MKKQIMMVLTALTLSAGAWAQGDVYERSKTYVWPTDELVLKKLDKWQDQKFGVLMHWGIYSVPGIVESWSICNEDWITKDTTRTFNQYKDWYWGLADQFNPTKFDPQQWANAMEDAGMKYMIFTTKHHDGFCMFDSRETDFSIAHHAFRDNPKRDVLKYVLEAFREKNFMIGTYPTGTHSTTGGMSIPTAGATPPIPRRSGPGGGSSSRSTPTDRWKKYSRAMAR